jgi:anti-sigma factor RsiW
LPLSEAGEGSATLEGYHILRWRDHERGYVAISDIDATELAAFATVFRRAASG